MSIPSPSTYLNRNERTIDEKLKNQKKKSRKALFFLRNIPIKFVAGIKLRAREEKQHSIKESVVLGERVGGYCNDSERKRRQTS